MHKKTFWSVLIILFAILSVLFFAMSGLADAGNFAGDTDYGGDWDSGSDWDSNSDWDSDWYYGGDIIDEGDSIIGDFGFGTILIVILVVYFLSKGYGKKNTDKTTKSECQQGGQPSLAVSQTIPLETLMEKDPLFSNEAFAERAANIYVQMQDYWQTKNWEPMRQYMTDSLFNQFNRQIEELKRLGRTNRIEQIAVLESSIYSYSQDEKNDIIILRLKSRIVDYTKDDASGNVVSGDPKREKFMEYEYTFIRSKGVMTPKLGETTQIHCPSCGAAMDVNNTGKCLYCGAVTQSSQYDWIISSIKGISQRTA